MDPDHKEKTAFTSYEGLYQFKYLSFGLCNTVTTFERLMEFVLRGLHWKMCILYIDDIIVFADEFESHIARLDGYEPAIIETGTQDTPNVMNCFERGQFRTLSTLAGSVEIPSPDTKRPKNLTCFWKKWHFLLLLFN
jgi:hypothetical protein